MTPLFSIVIPFYNAEAYLQDCIDSVIHQQHQSSFEVILVNDGSTDDSGYIARKYDERYSNLILIEQKNTGVSAARNTGIAHAKGDYILFLDADDYYTEGLFSSLQEYISNQSKPDIVSFGYTSQIGKHKSLNKYIHKKYDGHVFSGSEFTKKFLNKDITQCICSFAAKRSLLKTNNIRFNKNIAIGEDVSFQIKLMSQSSTIIYLAKSYFIYQYNPASATNKIYGVKYLSCKYNYQDVFDFIKKNELSHLKADLNWYYQLMFFYHLRSFLKSDSAILSDYLKSDILLNKPTKFVWNKYGFILVLFKFLYRVDKRILFILLC